MSKPAAYFDLEGRLHVDPAQAVTYVWVPTQRVSLLRVFVPGKSQRQWHEALPYALEEQLAEPLEQLHLVPLHRDKEGWVSVAVVAKTQMQAWLQALEAQGLAKLDLLADCFALPFEADQLLPAASLSSPCSLNQQLVRLGAFDGVAFEPQVWQKLPQALEVAANATLDWSSSAKTVASLGLRRGEFRWRNTQMAQWRPWMWPLVLGWVVVGLLLTQSWWQTQQYQQQAQAYQTQTEQLFRQLFPDTQRIVNIRVQTQSVINQQTAAQTQSGSVALLSKLEQAVLTDTQIQPGRAVWQNGGLRLHLTAPSAELLERLQQRLASDLEVTLQIQQVSADSVEGVIDVRSK